MSAPRAFVIAATGLAAEARIASRTTNVRAVAGFGDAARFAASLAEAIADGGQALISFGIAGGLRPGLRPGDIIVGDCVRSEGISYPTNEAWTSRLAQILPLAQVARVAGVQKPIASPRDKASLYKGSGAMIADMESHIAAKIAAEHGLPFAIVRVVADDALCMLPPAALIGLRSDGTVDYPSVLRSVARHPEQLPQLIRVAVNTARAMQSLLRCHRLLGAGLGFRDFR